MKLRLKDTLFLALLAGIIIAAVVLWQQREHPPVDPIAKEQPVTHNEPTQKAIVTSPLSNRVATVLTNCAGFNYTIDCHSDDGLFIWYMDELNLDGTEVVGFDLRNDIASQPDYTLDAITIKAESGYCTTKYQYNNVVVTNEGVGVTLDNCPYDKLDAVQLSVGGKTYQINYK